MREACGRQPVGLVRRPQEMQIYGGVSAVNFSDKSTLKRRRKKDLSTGAIAYPGARRPLTVAEPSPAAETKCRWAKAKLETPLFIHLMNFSRQMKSGVASRGARPEKILIISTPHIGIS